MAEPGAPSRARNFFGGVVDRLLPGSQYNSQTGQYSNVGRGVLGRLASIGGSLYGGPAVGALVNNVAGQWVDGRGLFNNGAPATPDAVVRQPLSLYGLSPNLGLPSIGAVTPVYNAPTGNGLSNPQPYNAWTPSSGWGAAQLAGTGDKPPSPFSAEGAYNSTNAPSAGGTSYDPTSATNQAWLFTNNMNRMNAMARDAIQKRMR